MSYKWKPSRAQRTAFAARMQDPGERAAYEQRKADRAARRRAGSQFDYEKAGGEYVPTKAQHDAATKFLLIGIELTAGQKEACNIVVFGYSCQEKVHHDYIHRVNELIRKNHIIINQSYGT